jgi:HEAT repeats
MPHLQGPIGDARTVDQLFHAALTAGDEEEVWTAIHALHWNGSDEVLDRARELCASSCTHERCIGAGILGQLGLPKRSAHKDCVPILLRMLENETDIEVTQSILIALSHQHSPDAIGPAVSFARHPNADVRYAAVLALSGYDDKRATDTLIRLTEDPDSNVSDWATFELGTLAVADSPAIRDALASRLTDGDFDTRGEALVGLARRLDQRVVLPLIRELGSDRVGQLAVEAAELIGDPQLLPALQKLSEWWDVNSKLVQRAIAACTPPSVS